MFKAVKDILVLSSKNSSKSQITEAYLRHFAKHRATIYSAGFENSSIHPLAVQVMKEDGIDISKHTSNNVLEYKDIPFEYVITVCDHAKEVCPYFPTSAIMFHHNFKDPSKVTGTEEEIAEARDISPANTTPAIISASFITLSFP